MLTPRPSGEGGWAVPSGAPHVGCPHCTLYDPLLSFVIRAAITGRLITSRILVRRVHRFLSREGLIVLIGLVVLLVAVGLVRGHSYSEVSDLVSIVVPLVTLVALLSWHRELLTEQAS